MTSENYFSCPFHFLFVSGFLTGPELIQVGQASFPVNSRNVLSSCLTSLMIGLQACSICSTCIWVLGIEFMCQCLLTKLSNQKNKWFLYVLAITKQ